MVDGQQRSRTIISYIDGQFKDIHGKFFDKKTDAVFFEFEFPVTIISDTEGESIERFYAIVNKTGIHLNKPEVRKADFYDTNYLKLVTDITNSKLFKGLGIFTDATLKRMNDIEFVAELVVLIKNGHVEKKDNMDEYFKKDLSQEDCATIKSKFNLVLTKISVLNKIFKLNKSRYKQRNDFYTLCDFLLSNPTIELETIKYFYKVLILIGTDIKPTQDACEPLKEYARNCVTQSNSKLARENRLKFFNSLLLNTSTKPTPVQSKIIAFYGLAKTDVFNLGDFITINVEKLSDLKPSIEFN